MPELPEVETVVRDLRPLLTGRTIVGARQSKHKLRRPWKPAWNAKVAGARVEAVRRRGKWILIDIAADPPPQPPSLKGGGLKSGSPSLQGGGWGGGSSLLRVHLGMSGQFTVVPAVTAEPDHLHVVFALDNGHELRLRDPRRFGSAEFFPDRVALELEMNAELGPEPFGLDANYFRTAICGTGRNLKAILLDQTIVAGVGNIYADEACFRAKLHPGRKGKSLTPAECDGLREAIEAVLTRAIESRGTTFDKAYVGGRNQTTVYGRTGEPCPTCETAIACARYAGRASHYCGSCQPLAVSRQPAKKKPKTGRRKSA